MPPKSRSIFRQPGAKHFQLVHRSQRDPLIHDPEASQHVLKQIIRENDKKGKSRAELESLLHESETIHDAKAHVGEAALYGIYYDDTEYDYMQHLRTVGVKEDDVESVLIEAPSTKKLQTSKKPESRGIELRDLPREVLPSTTELPRTYESQRAIPESISGFQPDMDPHLRQALEALEDDTFVDDDLEDDFFGELVQGGEREDGGEAAFEFYEYGPPDESQRDEDVADGGEEEQPWEERFAQFKKAQKSAPAAPTSEDDDFASEDGDTISGLPTISVIGGKKRRKGSSDASGYSMSSSNMYRNEVLQTLDERFDQIMLKQYNEDEEDIPPSDEEEEDEEAPQLIASREDFTSMMDEFLNEFEILGRKMKHKLEGDTGAEKLETLRRAMGEDERVRSKLEESEEEDDDEVLELVEGKKDRWDCETILTTYSNLENHPRLIRARDPNPVPKITLHSKTGLPSVGETTSHSRLKSTKAPTSFKNSDESDYEDDYSYQVRETITRPRDEDTESKKARKAAVKAQQAARRAEKKANKEAFGKELKAAKVKVSKQAPTGIKKL